jgi:hypothetical protein
LKKSKILCLNGSIEREKTINKISLTFETTKQLENWKVIPFDQISKERRRTVDQESNFKFKRKSN